MELGVTQWPWSGCSHSTAPRAAPQQMFLLIVFGFSLENEQVLRKVSQGGVFHHQLMTAVQ